MARRSHIRATMLASLLASLVLHATAAAILFWSGGRADADGFALRIDQDEKDTQRKVRLGIERSRAVTMTWIGFEEPTEHQAPLSPTEQPSLSTASSAGSTPAPGEPSPGGAASSTEAQPTPTGDWSMLAEGAAPAAPISTMRDLVRSLLQASARAMETASQASADAGTAQRDTSGGDVSVTGPGGDEDTAAGEPSDRQVDPSSRRRPLKVEPGQTVAAEGLEIKTRRPQWTTLTRAMANPKNPRVEITFGPDGRVRLARFDKDERGRSMSTGFREVDEPLINAIYRWTASGRAIDELDEDDPEAGVVILMEILLR